MGGTGSGRGRLVADRRVARKPTKTATKPRRSRKARRPARRGAFGLLGRLTGGILRLVRRIVVTAIVVLALLVGVAVAYSYTTLPDVAQLLDGRARGSVTMHDRNDEIFAWRGDQFGGAVTADSVSPHLRNAVIATEDRRFYWHYGVSPQGIAGAIRINLSEGRGPLSGHGGSTITQQTAKLLCLGDEYEPGAWVSEAAYLDDCRQTTLNRKAREAIYAIAMETKYTKDEILSIYLNRAYFGGGAYGAEAAAQRYFSKPAATLDPGEAAMLAGLLTAPSRLAPTADLQASQARAATVLRLMHEQDYIDEATMRQHQQNPATLSEEAGQTRGGYFADWVMQSGPDFFTRDTTEDVVIQTTLDQSIQRAVEDAVNEVFAEKVAEGSDAQVAVVVMSADGAVRGMVGGRKTNASGVFNRATQAVRQTGSAFKPFVYATALELGYSPNDTVVDEPFCMTIAGSGQWCPSNYTRQHYGRVTLTEALQRSLNIPAVKISEAVGRGLVLRVARDFGIVRELSDTPALALGAAEATLLEMTGAYAGILNGGSSVTPYGIRELRLKGDDTALMGSGGGIGERVISEAAAQQLTWMMQQVVEQGTGTRARLQDRPAAGKTGTSNEQRDAWFVGFTADYVTGVWMGYDDNTPLTGVTGGGLPAEIWHEVMARVSEGQPARPLPAMAPQPSQREEAPQVAQPRPQPQAQPREQQPVRTETVLERLLYDLLGGD
ncbi:transglycosylase domain-containing protein [Citreimonas salinaria]|uniref:peptidoglycan glycosyltransferase n=1 Tax=Citreimonas salinaria TaxID=321339 RepID=A0A1H3F2I2_9RHOB|nr:PBP1A family penicillin-binding protein [Citreimonas salinaria]SDX85182.1 penicillin-binding protein, 1A family [Citreimonas salinaria]